MYTLKIWGNRKFLDNKDGYWKHDIIQREYSSIDSLTQYLRRNPTIKKGKYIIFYGSEPVFFVGSTRVTFTEAKMKVQGLQKSQEEMNRKELHSNF